MSIVGHRGIPALALGTVGLVVGVFIGWVVGSGRRKEKTGMLSLNRFKRELILNYFVQKKRQQRLLN
jgi:Na+/glutamate symporter